MNLKKAIKERYESLACDSLGCGNNMVHARLQPGEIVLDLGCGSGSDALQAASIVGPAGRVIGVDLTPEMIDRATARARENNVHNVSFICGVIEELPLENASVDVVISNCVINHSPDKEKVFREIYRVLKNGGRFIISDAVSKEPLPDEVRSDPEAWAQCYGGAVTEEEYRRIIYKSGFASVELLNKREYVKKGFDFASITLLGCKYKEV